MLHFAGSIAVLTVFLAALYGWGRPLVRVLSATPDDQTGPSHGWAFAALLGLIVWGFIGGLLNLSQQMRPATLDALVLIGLALAAIDLARHRPTIQAPTLGASLPILIVWGSSLYLAATLLPTGVLNHGDDLQKYAVRPLQMLAEGALGKNPFDTLGHHSLGLQSLFHSLILNHFSLLYVGGFDQVLCYLLAGLLVNDLGRRAGAGPWLRSVALVTMVAVDPQWVNISSVYSSTLLVVGLAYAGLLLFEALDGPRKGAIGIGLLIGSQVAFLAALKISMAPYAIGFVGLLSAMALVHCQMGQQTHNIRQSRRRLGQASLSVAAGATLFILPWTLSYTDSYLSILNGLIRRTLNKLPELNATSLALPQGDMQAVNTQAANGLLDKLAQLFSDQTLYFNHHFIDYGAVVLLALLCGVVAGILVRRRDAHHRAALAVVVAASVTAATYYLLIPFVFGISYKGVRYLCPILVPLLPICAMLIAGRPGNYTPHPRRIVTPVTILAMAALLLVSGLFAERLMARGMQTYHLRTALAFPLYPFNLSNHRYAFDPQTRQRTRQIQALTKPGSTILTRTSTPFHLDFQRNRIFTMPEADFSAYNLGLLTIKSPNALRQKLLDYGVDYVLWKHTKPNIVASGKKQADTVRAQRRLTFNRNLATLALERSSNRLGLFDDGNTILFALTTR